MVKLPHILSHILYTSVQWSFEDYVWLVLSYLLIGWLANSFFLSAGCATSTLDTVVISTSWSVIGMEAITDATGNSAPMLTPPRSNPSVESRTKANVSFLLRFLLLPLQSFHSSVLSFTALQTSLPGLLAKYLVLHSCNVSNDFFFQTHHLRKVKHREKI